jgi:ribonuclease P protein component
VIGKVEAAMNDRRLTLPPRLRIRSQRDFDRVYQAGKHAADATLVLLACPNELAHNRLGVVVSRKVGNAVERNRWKRRIREAFRRTQHELPQGLDLIVRPRKGAVPEFAAIERSLPALARRLARQLRGG